MLPDKDYNRRIKPPWYVRVLLAFYGFLWLNMIFIVGLNSLRLGYIDYDSGSIFVALTLGLKLIFWYMDRFYEVKDASEAEASEDKQRLE